MYDAKQMTLDHLQRKKNGTMTSCARWKGDERSPNETKTRNEDTPYTLNSNNRTDR